MPSRRRSQVVKRCAEDAIRRIDREQCAPKTPALSPSIGRKIGMSKVQQPAHAGADQALIGRLARMQMIYHVQSLWARSWRMSTLVSGVSADIMRTMPGGLVYCVDGAPKVARGWSMLRVPAWLRARAGPAIPAPVSTARSRHSTRYGGSALPRPDSNPRNWAASCCRSARPVSTSRPRARFFAAIPRFAKTVASSDGYAALIGAGSGKPCALINIGTGVAGHRLWPGGGSVQRDAWGWIGGDRGSGAWIGRKALRHTLSVIDGIRQPDGLSERVLASAGGRVRLTEMLAGMTPDRLAALAPFVLAAADAGVPRAIEIRRRAIEHLTDLVRVLTSAMRYTLCRRRPRRRTRAVRRQAAVPCLCFA